jgi:hypothetical protein
VVVAAWPPAAKARDSDSAMIERRQRFIRFLGSLAE